MVNEHNEDSEDDGCGPATTVCGVMSPASKEEVGDLVADLLKSAGTGEFLPFFAPGDILTKNTMRARALERHPY